jgi:uncharacterized protein YyaL (SSP411 family)
MAVAWLLNSGIYILDAHDVNYGAVYSHYRSTEAVHELVYAEATGYVISLLKFLHVSFPQLACVGYARASGDWLVRWANGNHGIVAMGLKQGREIREAYTFDNGVCCKGLLDLYELTADERYLRCAENIANWILNEALNRDGSVKPVFDLGAGRFVQDKRIWYKVSGSFQAKIAMSLLQLAVLKKDRRLEDAGIGICDWAIRQQQPDGSFPANEMVKTAYTHFHWYTVEALLYAYAVHRMHRHLEAADRAVKWALAMQGRDGTLPRWCDGLGREKASDVQAQAIRAFSLMGMLNGRAELDEASRRASRFLLESQATHSDSRLRGGFFEGTARKYRYFVRTTRKMPSWATMFAIQALHLTRGVPSRDFFSQSRFLF